MLVMSSPRPCTCGKNDGKDKHEVQCDRVALSLSPKMMMMMIVWMIVRVCFKLSRVGIRARDRDLDVRL